jgi:hypothetical protein
MPKEKEEAVVIDDETVVAGDIPGEGEEAAEKKEEDDTSKEQVSKKEEEANLRVQKLEESQKRLMEVFTSPEFFSKIASSMKQPEKEVVTKATPEEVAAERQKLEDMSRQEFLAHTLTKVGKVATEAIKPEINALAGKISTFITGQANLTANSALNDFIERAGRAEFDKYAAAMEAKANATKGVSIDEIYTLVSGKTAPKSVEQRIPNSTVKPGEGTREATRAKDLPLEEAGARNFDQIFGKYKK